MHPDGQSAARYGERQRNGGLTGDVEYLGVGRKAVGIAIPTVHIERLGSAVDLPGAYRQSGSRGQKQHIDPPKRVGHVASGRGERASRAQEVDGGAALGERDARPGQRFQFICPRLSAHPAAVEVDFLGGRGHPYERRLFAYIRRVRKLKLAYGMARSPQRRLLHRGADFIDGHHAAGRAQRDPDAQRPEGCARRRDKGFGGHPQGIAGRGFGTARQVEHQCRIAHRACQDMFRVHTAGQFIVLWSHRHPPAAGFQTHETAGGGGNADRTARIRAVSDGHHAGCHRRRRTAAGSAGGAAEVPGILSRPAPRRLAHELCGEFRRIGAPQ